MTGITQATASNAGRPDALETASPGGESRVDATLTGVGEGSLILVAEDDLDTSDFISHFLSRAGFQVLVAANGEEVFRLLTDKHPNLFLLDCQMPQLDGFEVCQRLKEDPTYADTPVIFLTALSEPEDKKRGFEIGGVDFVTKPIEVIELLARLRNHLELATSRQILRRRADSLEEVVAGDLERFDEVRSGQASLLTQASVIPELKLAIRYEPAHVAGGDFYELARLSDCGEYGILVTDVSGHDLSVPYVTGALKALAGTFIKDALTPEETMLMLNASLQSFLRTGYYVTGCYAKYSREQMEVEVISAGHPPVLYQNNKGELEYIELTGDVLGMFDQPRFQSRRLPVQKGERLYLYTDGLIEGFCDEAGRSGRSLWGMQQLKQKLMDLNSLSLKEVVDGIVDGLLEESMGTVPDDIVVLGIEF